MVAATGAPPLPLYRLVEHQAVEALLGSLNDFHRHVLTRRIKRVGVGWFLQLPHAYNEYASVDGRTFFMKTLLLGHDGRIWGAGSEPVREQASEYHSRFAVTFQSPRGGLRYGLNRRSIYDPEAPQGHEDCPAVHARDGLQSSDMCDYLLFDVGKVGALLDTQVFLEDLYKRFALPLASLLASGDFVVQDVGVAGTRMP